MTAFAPAYPRRSFGGVLLGFLALIAVITVYLGRHAELSHPGEAERARNCIQQNGVWKVYQEPNSETYHWLCQDPTTKSVYDMIVEKTSEMVYREKTAFMPKGGNWNAIQRWLMEGLGKRGGKWLNPPTGPIELIGP